MTDQTSLINFLKEGIREYAPDFTDLQAGGFMIYKDILKEWNEKINLTAIEDDMDIILKHFIDSASILPFLRDEFAGSGNENAGPTEKNARLIDIGTGAGFPGIPVKIVYPALEVTLLDSLEKRVRFLDEVIGALELEGIKAVHGRAEDFGAASGFRESFDAAAARAVASLPVLLEYCLPFVKPGGIFIAMKGSSTGEIDGSGKALDVLGGAIEEVREITLPFSDMRRNIIVVRKLRQTPTKYPRKAGKPSKDPII